MIALNILNIHQRHIVILNCLSGHPNATNMNLIANFAKNYIAEKNSNAANMLHYSCSNSNITANQVIIAYCMNSAAIVSLQ